MNIKDDPAIVMTTGSQECVGKSVARGKNETVGGHPRTQSIWQGHSGPGKCTCSTASHSVTWADVVRRGRKQEKQQNKK